MSSEILQFVIALITGVLFTVVPLVIAGLRNKKIDKRRQEDEDFQNLLDKSHVVDERLDKYIERIENENKRLRSENQILDAKLDGMRELLIDCKDKLRIAQSLLEQFQGRKE